MKKIRKGDEVIVLAGKDKGKRGTVTEIVSDDKVIVEGVNRAKKHQKPNPRQDIQGGIIDKDMPIHISNIGLYNHQTNKADRVGFRFLDDGTKVRFFKSTKEVVDV
ncbi:MAG: 50S ribosomal protein L24 [Gammaproteobacteria bacterium]